MYLHKYMEYLLRKELSESHGTSLNNVKGRVVSTMD